MIFNTLVNGLVNFLNSEIAHFSDEVFDIIQDIEIDGYLIPGPL